MPSELEIATLVKEEVICHGNVNVQAQFIHFYCEILNIFCIYEAMDRKAFLLGRSTYLGLTIWDHMQSWLLHT